MSDGELQELLEGMAARAAGLKVSPTPAMIKEADGLRRALDRDEWVYGPAGSKNTPIFGAAALGRFEDIASSSQSQGEHSIPELGGDLLWEISVTGQELSFIAGGSSGKLPLGRPTEPPRPLRTITP
jgi:hypothetical protein